MGLVKYGKMDVRIVTDREAKPVQGHIPAVLLPKIKKPVLKSN